MSWTRIFRRRYWDQERARELEAYLEAETDDNISRGMLPEEARYAAHRKLGNTTLIREEVYHMNTLAWFESFWQDIRYGLRQLRRSPGFTAVAVLTLALGIGANTAVFSVAYAVLLKPLPYHEPSRLLRIYSVNVRNGGNQWMNSAADIDFLRRKSSDFQGVAFFQDSQSTLTGVGDAELVRTAIVSDEFFSTLGVPPLEGRTFLPDEYAKGRDQVAVLSETLRHHLFGNRAAIGQSLFMDGKAFIVVGAMPAEFHFPATEPPVKTDVWLPWSSPVDPANGNRDVAAIARLKTGASTREAEARMGPIHSVLERVHANEADWRLRLVPLQIDVAGDARLPILLILGAVSFVLLIACANVANLMLARGVARQKEMAVRTALGASRVRLVRQMLTETALLSLTGGGVGVVIAFWAIRALRATDTTAIPRLSEVQLSAPVLLFTLAVSVFVGLLFGLAPALPVSYLALVGGSGQAVVVNGRGSRNRSLNRFLLITQMALSLVLLIGAGLVVRSFLLLTSVNLGFQPMNVLSFYINLSSANYGVSANRAAFYQRTLDRIRALPSVESAALATSVSLNAGIEVPARIEGRPIPLPGQETNVEYQAVTSDYFRVMRIPLLKGRVISPSDGKDAPAVVVVNQAFARRFLPGTDPLGQDLYGGMGAEKRREIVGVVGDVHERGLAFDPSPEMYVPLMQAWISPGMAYMVKTRVEPLSAGQSIQRAVMEVDKDQPVLQLQTMEQIFYGAAAPPRLRTELLSLFSVLALVLTVVGLYGVMTYLVSQRTNEIGIRIALGAPPTRILNLVLEESVGLISAGILLGLTGAAGLARIMSSLLFEIKPTDPSTFALVTCLMVAVAFLACYIPARRATKVDPMVALRHE